MKQPILAWGKALALLLAVYLPTFMIVSAVAMSLSMSGSSDADLIPVAFPLVIGISLLIAVIVIAIAGGREFGSYGFRLAPGRTLLVSTGLGLAAGVVLRVLSWALNIQEPAAFTGLAAWQILVFFWIAAPIQEEIIFRGLVQTTLERGMPRVIPVGRWKLSAAGTGAAVLFALVHLGLLTAGASWNTVAFVGAGALLLGIIAGQFRWQTGSVIPGIVVHVMFNVFGSLGT